MRTRKASKQIGLSLALNNLLRQASIGIGLLLLLIISPAASLFAAGGVQSGEYGPEVKAFLEFLRQEEIELEFQINHNEINRRDYARSKNRIAIQRQTVLARVKESGDDFVPEIHVKAGDEISQLIENGFALVKRIKRGDVIKDKWRYLGTVTRGEVFYIFERLTPQ